VVLVEHANLAAGFLEQPTEQRRGFLASGALEVAELHQRDRRLCRTLSGSVGHVDTDRLLGAVALPELLEDLVLLEALTKALGHQARRPQRATAGLVRSDALAQAVGGSARAGLVGEDLEEGLLLLRLEPRDVHAGGGADPLALCVERRARGGTQGRPQKEHQ